MSISLPRFGTFSDVIALNGLYVPFSFSSPSGIPIMLILFLSLCSVIPTGVLQSFPFLFLFAHLTGSFPLSYQVTDASPWLSLILKLSTQFSSLAIVFFNSRISIWVLNISLSNFSFCPCTIFLISFSCLYFLVVR